MVRDPDGYIYLRERDGCILAGGFEPVAKPVYEEESKYMNFVNQNQSRIITQHSVTWLT